MTSCKFLSFNTQTINTSYLNEKCIGLGSVLNVF